MCQTEPFLDGKAGSSPLAARAGCQQKSDVKPHDEIEAAEYSCQREQRPAGHRLCFHWSYWCWLPCRVGREGAGDGWGSASTSTVIPCLISGSELHQPCTPLSTASPELCKDLTAHMGKREMPLSSSGGTKIAEIVETDVTVLPRLQHVMSVLAFQSWEGNVAEVNKVNAHGSQSEAGIGNVSHHGHTH